MSKSSNFFEGFVVGAIVGVVGGLLFAPQTGEETREKIRVKANEFEGPDSADRTENMIAKTLDAIDNGFEKLSKMVDKREAEDQGQDNVSSSGPKEKAA